MLELNKIYCGDCLELMKSIPDKSIDLVLTDPPYGISIDKKFKASANKKGLCAYKTDFGDTNRDASIPSKEYFYEMIRISKHCIIFGGNYFIENLTNSSCWIVWNKNVNGNFADCELAWTNFTTAVRKFDWTWNGMIQEDMGNKEIRQHPTQKPLQLFRRILENYSKKGETVLDCFLGSGTTAIACKEMGRNFIGIEKEQKYVDIANKRLQNTTIGMF